MATQTQALTLFQVEDTLNALAESVDLVQPDQEQQFLVELGAALLAAAEKRDRIAHVILRFEEEADFTKKEICRLTTRKQRFERGAERLRGYVQHVIEDLGVDGKGKYRALEGKTATLGLRRCPPSVDIKDEALVPLEFKKITVTMAATLMERILESIDLELHNELLECARKSSAAVDKKGVREAIDSGRTVPGTDLAIGKHMLTIS